MNLTRIRKLVVNLCVLLILGFSLANGQTCQMNTIPDVRGSDAQYDSASRGSNLEECKDICLNNGACLATEYRGSTCLFSTKHVDAVFSPGDTVSFKHCSGENTTSKNVICYYQEKKNAPGVTTYNTSDIDTFICTHLVYYYVLTVDFLIGEPTPKEVWTELQDLKLFNPSLKVLLGILNNRPDRPYSDQDRFFSSIFDFLRTWQFDGIDWIEFSYSPISNLIVTLMEDMHSAMVAEANSTGKEPLILMFSGLGWEVITEEVDLHPLGMAVDILRVMPEKAEATRSCAYTSMTCFGSPMFGNDGYYGNVSASITDFVDAGIPPEKLHIGIDLSAITFTLDDSNNTGVGAPASPRGEQGEYTQSNFFLAYYEVCKRLQEEGYTAEFDPEGLVNFAYKGDQWMSYEDPASLEIKMQYVHDNNLGGVAVTFLPFDDYTGQFCNQGRYPLISTLYNFVPEDPTTTTVPPTTTTTLQPQICPNSIDTFPDPYSCQHYRMCVFDMLFRSQCESGLSYDADQKMCVQNPTTPCVTVPPPDTTPGPAF